ncbi:23.6 kDa heat shock protein, mitochondrial [Artemisia annua]|uniref:23.6 kDa heat shock protein, mitochondrial n=1 Tax=Artemisia annua TaxID=35608 RepID=A0A2U1LMQ0_ARTAN|nr:23.6 kDa heat shock protein, mitochondrial [Artemisia annua]
MVYRPVIMKQLLASNLLGRFVVPLFRPAAATEVFDRFSPTFGRRSYHIDLRDEDEVTPDFDRREDAENCYVFVHMPGLNKGDVKSKVVGRRYSWLTIEGDKVQEGYMRIKYKDDFDIPEFIKGSGTIVGEMNDGELTITLPKLKEGESNEDFEVEIN